MQMKIVMFGIQKGNKYIINQWIKWSNNREKKESEKAFIFIKSPLILLRM